MEPLLPRFLGIWGQKRLLDIHAALQSQVLLNQDSYGPWVHLVMPCQLSDASLRIFSHGGLDHGDGGECLDCSLTSAPWPWREVLAIILQLFYLKNQAPTDSQFVANLPVVPAHTELLPDKLAGGVIHGN